MMLGPAPEALEDAEDAAATRSSTTRPVASEEDLHLCHRACSSLQLLRCQVPRGKPVKRLRQCVDEIDPKFED